MIVYGRLLSCDKTVIQVITVIALVLYINQFCIGMNDLTTFFFVSDPKNRSQCIICKYNEKFLIQTLSKKET